MASMSAKNVTMTDQRSHWVRLTHGGDLDKEEIFITFTADWRGDAVTFRMEANRYCHSNGISEFRIFCTGGKVGNDYHAYNAKDLSDTARTRLTAVARPMVQAWLESVSYEQAYAKALTASIKRLVGSLSPGDDTLSLHAVVNMHAATIGFSNTTRLKDAISAFRTFSDLYRAL